MQNTCCECKCAFVQSGMIDCVEDCPNFMETLWSKEDETQPLLIRDCSPKRQLVMMQELHNRVFSVQQTQTEQRNAASTLASAILKASKTDQIEGKEYASTTALPNQ